MFRSVRILTISLTAAINEISGAAVEDRILDPGTLNSDFRNQVSVFNPQLHIHSSERGRIEKNARVGNFIPNREIHSCHRRLENLLLYPGPER